MNRSREPPEEQPAAEEDPPEEKPAAEEEKQKVLEMRSYWGAVEAAMEEIVGGVDDAPSDNDDLPELIFADHVPYYLTEGTKEKWVSNRPMRVQENSEGEGDRRKERLTLTPPPRVLEQWRISRQEPHSS